MEHDWEPRPAFKLINHPAYEYRISCKNCKCPAMFHDYKLLDYSEIKNKIIGEAKSAIGFRTCGEYLMKEILE